VTAGMIDGIAAAAVVIDIVAVVIVDGVHASVVDDDVSALVRVV
jgi:hypothetical protein